LTVRAGVVSALLLLAAFTVVNAPVSVTTTTPTPYTYLYTASYVTTDPFMGPYTFTNVEVVAGFGEATSTATEPFYRVAANPTIQQPFACRYLTLTGAIFYCAVEYARIMTIPLILLLILAIYVLVAAHRKPTEKQKTLEDFPHG